MPGENNLLTKSGSPEVIYIQLGYFILYIYIIRFFMVAKTPGGGGGENRSNFKVGPRF